MAELPPPSTTLPPPPAPSAAPAGWYPDPTDPSRWRWWDGRMWTAHVSAPIGPRPPRLPRFLSPPVLGFGIVSMLMIVVIGILSPRSVAAGLIPLAIVLPALSWLDRVEPEPWSSRIHALLWGAGVAVVVSAIVNLVVGAVLGEVVAIVIGAPLVEEGAKALGIVWAVRRREIDGVSDGVVFAGWVALGFAVVEDMLYFSVADIDGTFASTVVLRAFLTPFAHPLFTVWTGLAIGRAVSRRRPIWPSMIWGLALAVLLHATWNGALVLAEVTYDVDEGAGTVILVGAVVLFVAVFVAGSTAAVIMRRREQRRFMAAIPALVARHGMSPDEAAMFSDWRTLLRARRRLPRSKRRDFDRLHAALARLAATATGGGDDGHEAVLAEQLRDALIRVRG